LPGVDIVCYRLQRREITVDVGQNSDFHQSGL
jgi:hypothetical protein